MNATCGDFTDKINNCGGQPARGEAVSRTCRAPETASGRDVGNAGITGIKRRGTPASSLRVISVMARDASAIRPPPATSSGASESFSPIPVAALRRAAACSKPAGGRISDFIERLLRLIDAMVGALSSSPFAIYFRVAVCVSCFLVIIGVVGGIESGLITWSQGIIAAVVAAALEALCIIKRG